MLRFALLIDGAFLYKRLKDLRKPTDANAVEAFVNAVCLLPPLAGAHLHRVYYYHASAFTGRRNKPLNGGQVDFGAHPSAQGSMTFHNRLKEKPYIALRLGETVFRGWKLDETALQAHQSHNNWTIAANDLQPNIQQKGVDMRIGLDISSLTLKQHVDIIVLVTGDADFVPAMKFARREGAQLYLVSLGSQIAATMKEHSDLVLSVPQYP
jgi:uncharacterized LabA/DUF88 family protein